MLGGLLAAAVVVVAGVSELMQRGPGFSSTLIGVALLAISAGLMMQLRLNAHSARLREAELIAGTEALRAASEQLEQLVVVDALTGVLNRRGFDEQFSAECTRLRRYSQPLSLLMIDVDDFKQMNDALGHLTGDFVLTSIAQALSASVRASDIVARQGGDEFAVVLPKTDHVAAETVTQKLQSRIREHYMSYGGTELAATISIGVATLPEANMSMGGLIGQADEALYAAKRAGKDRVVAAPMRAAA
ncbi:MAG TPA: GGDEF domain-containing protein [Dehalococcoidia bacterium]|nr:GGDEF domain-containing protein [Dehalococcoidia bacterium]